MVITVGSPSPQFLSHRASKSATASVCAKARINIQGEYHSIGNVNISLQSNVSRTEGRGMSVVVGGIREGSAFGGVKHAVRGHNTGRGTADCAVPVVEPMRAQRYL